MSSAKDKIKKLEEDIRKLYGEIFLIKMKCEHVIVPDDPDNLEDSCRVCSECGESHYDWYCPDNPPTHACEYGDYEGCIHCGKPQERR